MFEDFQITPELKALYKAQDEATEIVPCAYDPDLFFPEKNAGRYDFRAIRNACASCPVVAQCAEYGLSAEEEGVWGGLFLHERNAIKRARRAQSA